MRIQNKNTFAEKFKPAVPRNYLLAIAGVMWSAVGLILCWRSYVWLKETHGVSALLLALLGIIFALIVFQFGFSRIARKNIDRIYHSHENACIFSFQAWKSYLIIVVMISLGIFLRRSPIPRQYLAVVYLTIGCALFLSSLLYYSRVWKIRTDEQPCK